MPATAHTNALASAAPTHPSEYRNHYVHSLLTSSKWAGGLLEAVRQ
jgi:hypothetical protein